MRDVSILAALLGLIPGTVPLRAAEPVVRYALILEDAPAAQRVSSGRSMESAEVQSYRERVRTAQLTVRSSLAARGVRVTGAAQTVMNAVFVEAPASRLPELRAMNGVKYVAPLHRFRLHLNRAVQLENVPAAWNALGGVSNAGAGVKIAIIDTGIDISHPAFQDSSLKIPAGFPKCTDGAPSDCAFTNRKVIVARSYVSELASGALSGGASESRPDDVSPRDHIGHGTAQGMITAGMTNTGPTGISITGMAPKAWLGNYKVFGSPGLNDFTGGDVLIRAVDDALNDGMNVAVMALGSPAVTGPLDTGAACGAPAGTPCDPEAMAVENAVQAGMLISVSAGNSGDSGQLATSLGTVESPSTAPSAIAAAASTNSHTFANAVHVTGSGIPSNLQNIPAEFGDGPFPGAVISAPLADVAKIGDQYACTALPAGSLRGSFALIVRSGCTFAVKVANAEDAGAAGVILINNTGDDLFSPSGLSSTHIPAALVGSSAGTAMKGYLASHAGARGSFDPSIAEVNNSSANAMASFSSRGPSITYLLKPEVTGVGTNVYMATQRFDPYGEMYDASGYIAASGTSFSAPMAAGIAALVKQKHPEYNALDLKSAVVNTATQDLTDDGATASVLAAGNGKVNGGNAVASTVTVNPATVSFGAIGQTANLPVKKPLSIHYSGAGPATLALSISGNRAPALDKTTLTFAPGSPDQTVTLTLSGSVPPPGAYDGALTIQGGGTSVRVPYLYLVGDGVPNDIIPLAGNGFDGPAGQSVPGGLGFKIVDQYGVAVPNVTVRFSASSGGGSIASQDPKTDAHGVAFADALLSATPGTQAFTADAGGLSETFSGIGRAQPVISPGGVVNAASFLAGTGIVPGSYISIFGNALSDTVSGATALPLPLAISQASVSFEVPAANVSLPGRLLYADPKQVNVQVPWELAGQSSVQIRVNVGQTTGAVYTAQIAQYAPAIYESGDQLAAALDESNQLITSGNPAARGHAVQLFANALGAVSNTPPTGEAAQSSPLSKTSAAVNVTVGGKTATVSFAGLAPGFPGLDQVNFTVPPDAPLGPQPVIVSVSGVSSAPLNIYVK